MGDRGKQQGKKGVEERGSEGQRKTARQGGGGGKKEREGKRVSYYKLLIFQMSLHEFVVMKMDNESQHKDCVTFQCYQLNIFY